MPFGRRSARASRDLREWLAGDKLLAERNAPAVIGKFLARIDEVNDALAAAQPTLRTVVRVPEVRSLWKSPSMLDSEKSDMLAHKRALMDTPTNYGLRVPDMSLPEAVEANAARKPFPTLNPSTVNDKWLSHISTILSWCANDGLVEDNPARGVKIDEGKGFKEPSRVGFNQDDLKRIFGHAMFAEPKEYGTRQWALLIALYTGARSSSEVARIKLSDVYQEQGIWAFNLEEANQERAVAAPRAGACRTDQAGPARRHRAAAQSR